MSNGLSYAAVFRQVSQLYVQLNQAGIQQK